MAAILAIDPGTTQSAIVRWNGTEILNGYKRDNNSVMDWLPVAYRLAAEPCRNLYIEQIASYGLPVGREVFDTCVWVGRFMQSWIEMGGQVKLVLRGNIKKYFKAQKDSQVRQALLTRFGQKGTKANPGLLYGVSGDVWQALALAVYAKDCLEIAR